MSIAMWEAIAENKRRSAILIVSMALILGGLAGVIGYGVGGTEESAALGALAGLAVWGVLLLVNLAGGESVLLSSANFLALQEELASTENKISFARQAYNDSVTLYNTRIQTIPANFIAGPAGFRPRDLFELKDEAERAVPEVKF